MTEEEKRDDLRFAEITRRLEEYQAELEVMDYDELLDVAAIEHMVNIAIDQMMEQRQEELEEMSDEELGLDIDFDEEGGAE